MTPALVLVVDDFDDARELYRACLEQAGYRTAEARNGQEAVERAIELQPAVVLLDLAMPVMDGVEAARRLKADERTRDAHLIALTGYAVARYAQAARDAGCERVLVKPVLPSDLVLTVEGVLRQIRS
ncbi:MAG TPA: response regulator [Vicinamibacterales bacterium]|jgi:CheY-like chemotaxis protein